MEVLVKKLSPELKNDYIEFFNNKAFADDSEFAGCYCTWYHWNEELEAERSRCSEDEKSASRENLPKCTYKKV
jgi:hypothetical protein